MVRVSIDLNKCTGCGECTKVCMSHVLIVEDDKCAVAYPDMCRLCMSCKIYCPVKAITIA